MQLIDPIPDPIYKKLNPLLEADEEIRIALESDIDAAGHFNPRWLVMTDRRVMTLDLNGNDQDLEVPLADLTNVEFVTFWETNISDLTPLKGWKNLKSIELRLTKVTDYSPLHGLTNLKSLATNRRLISDKQLAMLKQALPNCKIEIETRYPQRQ